MEITFINVGYGESILITCPDPEARDGRFVMLIDGAAIWIPNTPGTAGGSGLLRC